MHEPLLHPALLQRSPSTLSATTYVAPLVFFPCLLLLLGYLILTSPWYARSGADIYMIGLGYGGTLKHADCQIVIYGDSTGMVGIDPARLKERTGLSTCSIGETDGMIIMNGNMVLDRYLSQNAAPRYLVFLFAPEDLDPNNQTERHGVGEGIAYRMREDNWLGKLAFAAAHPADSFRWVFSGLDSSLRHIRGPHFSPDQMQVRERTHGQLLLDDPPMTQCSATPHRVAPNKAWIDTLRADYQQAGITVLVDAMPVPECDVSLDFYRQLLPGAVDNGSQTLPPSSYFLGGRHVNRQGSLLLTDQIADQLLQHLATAGGAR